LVVCRDDIERSEVSKQIALAIADEVSDLQDAGIKIIQVDEAAFKEGYPLRQAKSQLMRSGLLEISKSV